MIKIVNSTEGARIRELSEFKEMLSDQYLSNLRVAQTKFIYEQFFKGDKSLTRLERLKLLNMTLNMPATIAEKLADFVGKPNIPYEIDVFEQVASFSWAGYSVMKAKLVDGQFEIEYASPDGYVKYDDGGEQLLTFIEDEDLNGKKTDYVFEQFYRPGEIFNTLYKLKTDLLTSDSAFYGEVANLDDIPATRGIPPYQRTQLRQLNPIVVVHNARLGAPKYGRSEIKRIRSMLSSIEIQIVNIQDQLLKHLSAILAIPSSKLPTDEKGMVDIRRLEIIQMEAGDTLPAFVSNTNPLIEQSFKTIETLLLQIGTILSIPVEFFNIKTAGGVEAAQSKNIRISPFLKKIQRVRDKMTEGFLKMHELAKMWGVALVPELTVMWDEVFPIDKGQEVVELATAKDNGFISHIKAIMRYQDVDEKTAEAEKALIDQENATIGADQLPV